MRTRLILFFTNKAGSGPIVNIKRAWNNAFRKTKLGYGYRNGLEYVAKWQDKLPAGPIFMTFAEVQ